jgi:hypothetical protein
MNYPAASCKELTRMRLKSVILQLFLRVLLFPVLQGCKMTDFNGPEKNNFVHHEFSA